MENKTHKIIIITTLPIFAAFTSISKHCSGIEGSPFSSTLFWYFLHQLITFECCNRFVHLVYFHVFHHTNPSPAPNMYYKHDDRYTDIWLMNSTDPSASDKLMLLLWENNTELSPCSLRDLTAFYMWHNSKFKLIGVGKWKPIIHNLSLFMCHSHRRVWVEKTLDAYVTLFITVWIKSNMPL